MNSSLKIKPPGNPLSVMDAINTRCSVRHYAPNKLDRDTVHVLLDAAVRAPTAIHAEPWAFVVIQDTQLLRQVSDIAKVIFAKESHHAFDRGGHALDIFQQPEFNIFYDSSTLIVICGNLAGPFVVADCWLAAENLMLAACALGLGTCVIGSAVGGLNNIGTEDAIADTGRDDGHRADHRRRTGGRNSRFTSQAPTAAGLEVRPPVAKRAL